MSELCGKRWCLHDGRCYDTAHSERFDLGGMGSIVGAFWGGMTIGLVQQMSTLILPAQLQNAAIFVVFLLIVFFRPQGFFGRNVERT